MKEYNKEKLHEYAKELFALCLEKEIVFYYDSLVDKITTRNINNGVITHAYICSELFDLKTKTDMPIWELIEKVKQL